MHGGGNFVAVKGGCLDGIDQTWWKSANTMHIWTKRAIVPVPEGVEKFDEDPPRSG